MARDIWPKEAVCSPELKGLSKEPSLHPIHCQQSTPQSPSSVLLHLLQKSSWACQISWKFPYLFSAYYAQVFLAFSFIHAIFRPNLILNVNWDKNNDNIESINWYKKVVPIFDATFWVQRKQWNFHSICNAATAYLVQIKPWNLSPTLLFMCTFKPESTEQIEHMIIQQFRHV